MLKATLHLLPPPGSSKSSVSPRSLGVGWSGDAPWSRMADRCCSCFLPWSLFLARLSSLPPRNSPSSPISLGLRAEEELSLGALGVVPQEESEEVFVSSVQFHLTLFPTDGREGSMVEYQESATPAKQRLFSLTLGWLTPAKHEAFQPDAGVVGLHPSAYLYNSESLSLACSACKFS